VKRNLRAVLILSVGLNLVLVLACWLRFARKSELAQSPVRPPSAPRVAVGVIEKITTNMVAVTAAPKVQDWRAVESDDYKTYIANLRAIGCPETTLRDIIVADVNELYRHRFLLTFPLTNRVEYWKPGDALANLIDEGHVARLQELAKEKRELIRTLLGTDYSSEVELASIQMDVFMERLLDFLTPEKRTAMKELEQKYTAKILNTFKDSVRGDNQSSKAVLAAKDEDVLKILIPEEKLEYDLRRSNDAMHLRVALGDFEVTEQEFRDIFPAMKQFVAEAGVLSLMAIVRGDGDPREQTLAARQELRKALKSALGEQRFGELMEGTGWNLRDK
jgi:hypothetical protein